VTVSNNSGTLTLTGDATTLPDTYRTLSLTLHAGGSIGDLTSADFALTIAGPTVSAGAQTGELRAGETGTLTFPVTTTLIGNGTYDITLDGLPGSITAPETLTITGNIGTLELSGSLTLPGTRNLRITITAGEETAVSEPFTMTIRPAPGAENIAVAFAYLFTEPTPPSGWTTGFNNATSPQVEIDVTNDGDYLLALPPWPGGNGTLATRRNIYLAQPIGTPGDRITIRQITVNGTAAGYTVPAHTANGDNWFYETAIGIQNPVVINNTQTITAAAMAALFAPAGLELRRFVLDAGAFTIPAGAIVEIIFKVGEGGMLPPGDRGNGDVDGDGKIDSSDVTFLRRFIASGLTPEAFGESNPIFNAANARVRGYHNISAADVTVLRRMVAERKTI
jgi:hypothetical protein